MLNGCLLLYFLKPVRVNVEVSIYGRKILALLDSETSSIFTVLRGLEIVNTLIFKLAKLPIRFLMEANNDPL